MNIEKLKSITEEVSDVDQLLDNDPALWVALVTVSNIVNNRLRSNEEKEEILQKIKKLLEDNQEVYND